MPMCQLAKKASRQPPQAAEEDDEANLDSTGCRALVTVLMLFQCYLWCNWLLVPLQQIQNIGREVIAVNQPFARSTPL